MARRLSGRQLLDQIFADESDPEDSESINDANSSSSSDFQVESDDWDSEEANDDGGLADEQSEIEETDVEIESTSDSNDDDVLYSIAESTPVSLQLETMLVQLGRDGYDERRSGDSFLSKNSTERWLPNAPTARLVLRTS